MFRKIIVPITIAVIASVFIALVGQLSIAEFVDLPSLIIVPLFAYLYVAASWGVRGIGRAYRTAFKKDGSDSAALSEAAAVFKHLQKALWLFTILAMAFSLIALFANIDPSPTALVLNTDQSAPAGLDTTNPDALSAYIDSNTQMLDTGDAIALTIGMNLAVSLIVLLYGVFFNLVLVQPCIMALQQRRE
jgi:flagellar motor component MotA